MSIENNALISTVQPVMVHMDDPSELDLITVDSLCFSDAAVDLIGAAGAKTVYDILCKSKALFEVARNHDREDVVQEIKEKLTPHLYWAYVPREAEDFELVDELIEDIRRMDIGVPFILVNPYVNEQYDDYKICGPTGEGEKDALQYTYEEDSIKDVVELKVYYAGKLYYILRNDNETNVLELYF